MAEVLDGHKVEITKGEKSRTGELSWLRPNFLLYIMSLFAFHFFLYTTRCCCKVIEKERHRKRVTHSRRRGGGGTLSFNANHVISAREVTALCLGLCRFPSYNFKWILYIIGNWHSNGERSTNDLNDSLSPIRELACPLQHQVKNKIVLNFVL